MPPRWRCPDCPATYGAWLSRCPRCRSDRELVAVLNECANCTTAFAVGLLACPHCGSTDFAEQGAGMPKITAHGGPTIAGAQVTGGAWSEGPDEDAAESAPAAAPAAQPDTDEPEPVAKVSYGGEAVEGADVSRPSEPEGGEEPSPGSSSETSPGKPPTSTEPSKPSRPSRARKTANRSKKAPTGSSSAPLTGGGQTADGSEPDSEHEDEPGE